MKNTYLKPAYIKHRISNIISITKIVTIHYFEFGKDFNFHLEKHDFWEMVYIDSGQANVVVKNKTHLLNQGDVIFIRPNLPHKLCGDCKNSFNAFIISFTSNSNSLNLFSDNVLNVPKPLRKYIALIMSEGENVFILKKNNPYITEMEMHKDIPIGSIQMIRIYLEQFLIMLLRGTAQNLPNLFTNKENMENHIIVSVKQLLSDNLYGNISVEEICDKLHYSRTYLSKTFKQYCNTTINHYYNDLKIKEAKKLICEGKHNFTQISEMLGFNNPHYFTRVFKKITNMTPTEYLNSSNI